MRSETIAIRTQTERTGEKEHSTPLFLTSSFVYDSAEDMAEAIRWVASLPKHFNVNHLEVSHILNSKYM